MISIELETATGVLMMDESQTTIAPPVVSTLSLTATVGGDTSGKGVTWTFMTKQSGCAGTGLAVGDCGTLTNNMPFGVTYTAPAINVATSVIIEAMSNANINVTKTITLSIVLPPVFATTECNPSGVLPCTLPNGNNAVPYTQSFTFTGGVEPYTYVLMGSLPQCLTLEAASATTTGTIVGTPCSSGTSQFTVTVTDSGGAAPVSQAFIITIAPPPPLSVTVAPLPAGTADSTYNGSIPTQGGQAPLTWTLSVPNPVPPGDIGGLPPGLALNGGTGQITGIPINESPGVAYPATYVFGIQVKDSALPPQLAPQPPAPPAQFSITIQLPQPLSISTPVGALTPGITATAYTATLNASGGVPPYTWSVIQGQLPSGLSLSTQANGTGTITGTPILVTTATFTIQVTDSAVNPANGKPAPAMKSAQFSIAISAGAAGTANALLSGQYSFLFTGFDSDGPVTLAGTLTANGSGDITAGTIDSNRVSGVALGASVAAPSTTTTGSFYSMGTDGRGTMELNFTFGQNAAIVADYDLVMDSNGNVKFFENYTTATSVDPKHTHGEGVMKLVVGPASFGAANFSGNYAFVLPGYDPTGKPAGLAGVVHSNGTETLSPGTGDLNDAGTYSPQLALSGSYTFSSGVEGTAMLTFAPNAPQVTLNFDYFFVTPSDIYFIETDSNTKTLLPAGFLRLSGEMILQQTGAAFNTTTLQGVSVASGTGIGSGGNASVFAGLLTSTLCNDSAAVSLTYDENNGGAINGGGASPISFAGGTCAITATGRVGFTGLGASAAQTRVAAAYLTGPGQGFLIGSDAAVTTGHLEQQTSGPAFALTSFLDGYTLTAPFVAEAGVKNVIGQTTADGAGDLAGTVDEIDPTGAAKPNLAQVLSASFTNPAPNGRGTIATTAPVPSGFPTASAFYVVSPESVRIVSSDSTDTHPQLILLDH
jgi:Putative Ig domain